MPVMLLSFKKTTSGRIMLLGFLAGGERDAEKDLEAYAAACPQFGAAHKAGETFDQAIEVDELPEFDEDSIAEFCDGLFGLEDDGVDGDEDDDEPEGEDEEEDEDEKEGDDEDE